MASGPPGCLLHRSGPWLVVYGRGPESEDAGYQVHEQCAGRDVESVLCPIDEIARVRADLFTFTGLVAVLPTQLGPDSPTVLRMFAELIVDYRARRPAGLDSILNDTCKWFKAGVVQVVGQRAIMRQLGRTALDGVCGQHHTDDPAPLDVFRPYTARGSSSAKQPAGEVYGEEIERLWRDVQTWGVTDMHTVPKLRKRFDDCRDYYEHKRFAALYRPIKELARNILDIILDGPHSPVGNVKTWNENAARVCREVVKELKGIVPDLSRPGGRDGTKGAQEQLRRLYFNLRIIDNALRGRDELDALPNAS